MTNRQLLIVAVLAVLTWWFFGWVVPGWVSMWVFAFAWGVASYTVGEVVLRICNRRRGGRP